MRRNQMDNSARSRPIKEKKPFVYDSVNQTARPTPADDLDSERARGKYLNRLDRSFELIFQKEDRGVRTQGIGRGKRRVKVKSADRSLKGPESVVAVVHIPYVIWAQRLTTKHYKEMWIVTRR